MYQLIIEADSSADLRTKIRDLVALLSEEDEDVVYVLKDPAPQPEVDAAPVAEAPPPPTREEYLTQIRAALASPVAGDSAAQAQALVKKYAPKLSLVKDEDLPALLSEAHSLSH